MRPAVAVTLALIALPSTALANPVPLGGPLGAYIGLMVETVLIATVLGRRGFDPVRCLYAWSLVTGTTYMLLAGGSMILNRWEIRVPRPLAREFLGLDIYGLDTLFLLALVVAEVLIVLVEAFALQRMTRHKFFQGKGAIPLRFRTALAYSLLGNVLSLMLGS